MPTSGHKVVNKHIKIILKNFYLRSPGGCQRGIDVREGRAGKRGAKVVTGRKFFKPAFRSV